MGPLPVLFPPQAKFPPAAVRQILHCLSLWSLRMTASFILFEFNSSWSIVVKQGLYCASKEGDHSILPARVAPSERSFNAPTSSNWISSRISFVRSSPLSLGQSRNFKMPGKGILMLRCFKFLRPDNPFSTPRNSVRNKLFIRPLHVFLFSSP